MDILFYAFAILIVVFPYTTKKIHFLDIAPLFLFYFDATRIFVRHLPSYQYFEGTLIILVSLNMILGNKGKSFKNFGVFAFVCVALFCIPLIQGESLNQTLRSLTTAFGSLIFLPLSFNHYMKTGNLKKLYLSTFIFIVLYVVYVAFATPLKLGGFESERVAGKTFYFGHIAIRGGITYITFVIFLIPMIIPIIKYWQKIVLAICVIAVFIFLLTVLKRFVFVILGLAVLNYLIRPVIKTKFKIRIVLAFSLILLLIFSSDFIMQTTANRFKERGAENRFSSQAMSNDLRIYEPFYVFQSILNRPPADVIIGQKGEAIFELEHNDFLYEERAIHNSYAKVLSTYGIIGLVLYLAIYFKFYRFISRFYHKIKKGDLQIYLYWIAFQNMFLLFAIQGMVGGHEHITLRGLIFLYSGALGGYIYNKYLQEKKKQTKTVQISE